MPGKNQIKKHAYVMGAMRLPARNAFFGTRVGDGTVERSTREPGCFPLPPGYPKKENTIDLAAEKISVKLGPTIANMPEGNNRFLPSS